MSYQVLSAVRAHVPSLRFNRWSEPPAWAGYAAAGWSVAAVSLIIGWVLARTAIANLSMIYLVPVLALAVTFGRGAAVFASVLAFLSYNWFFTEPRHTFTIQNPSEWLALLLFLLVAVVCGELAASMRRRAREAEQREREAQWLYLLGELLAAPDALQDRLAAAARWLVQHLDLAAASVSIVDATARQEMEGQAGEPAASAHLMRMAREGPPVRQVLTARSGAPGMLPRPRWVRLHRGLPAQPAPLPPWDVRTVPLVTGSTRAGTLRLVRRTGAAPFTPQQDQLLLTAGAQIALAVERARLQATATEAAVLRRADELKTALLDSVSHDLRTPLAGIKAAASSLRQKNVPWSVDDRDGFAAAIEHEADRLDRFVGHLLDLSRIESGSLRPEKEWHPLSALVDDVVGRLRPLLSEHPLEVDVPADLPPVPMDYVQISEVLTNLLENALKYTPPGTLLMLSAKVEDGVALLRVTDAGPGIPAQALPRVFDKFYRVEGTPGGRSRGSGLGLAVARGLVEAHGGRIWAESTMGQGASFVFTLPLEESGTPLRSGDEVP